MERSHHYAIHLQWTGNRGEGTTGYRNYERSYDLIAAGKPIVQGSSDPAFRGDGSRYNPEDLLVCSLSACHMLTYLHLCAIHQVVVVSYQDEAFGTMVEEGALGGHFSEVVLRPRVVVKEASMVEKANALHGEAHQQCFIASSVNFPVRHEPECMAA